MTLDKKIKISLATTSDREKIYKIRHNVFASELGQYTEKEQGKITDQFDNLKCYQQTHILHEELVQE